MYKISEDSLRTLIESSNLLTQLEVRGPQNAIILVKIAGIVQAVINSAEEEKGEVISNVKPAKIRPLKEKEQ